MTHPSSASRPLITFALLTFNDEETVVEAVRAALAQTYTPLQILISDDSSSDGTFDLAQEAAQDYAGPHEVRFLRTPKNLNVCGHIEWLMPYAAGKLIVGAAGDDISYPERTQRLFEQWKASNYRVHSLYSRMDYITMSGSVVGQSAYHNLPAHLPSAMKQSIQVSGCTHAWTPDVFEAFGSMLPGSAYEDLIIPFRSLLLGGVAFIDEPLVKYRVGNLSLSRPDSDTVGKAFALTLTHLRNLENVYANYLADIETYERSRGIIQADVKELASRRLNVFADKQAFLKGGTAARARFILKYAAVEPVRAAKWLAMAILPWMYKRRLYRFWYKRRHPYLEGKGRLERFRTLVRKGMYP